MRAIEIDEEGNFIDERPVSGNNRNNEPCDPLGFRDAGSDTKKSADLYEGTGSYPLPPQG